MTRLQRVRYEVFLQASDFGRMHSDLFPASSKGGQLFGRLAELIAQIEEEGRVRMEAVTKGYHTGSTREVLKRWMLDIAGISRDLAREGAPGIVPLKMPAAGNDATLLTAAHQFLKTGASFSDEIAQRGLGEQWSVAFKNAIDAFAAHRGQRREGRIGATTARAGVAGALKSGTATLRSLDGIVTIVLREHPALMEAWQQARRISSGRVKADEPAPEVTPQRVEGDLQKAS